MKPILLFSDNIPDELVRGAHPHDYEEVEHFEAQFLTHDNRLIARIPWKTPNGSVVPVTFSVATGAPGDIYLCDEAMSTLDSKGILQYSGEQRVAEVQSTPESSFTAFIEHTPASHKNSNVLGSHALGKLGLQITEKSFCFCFNAEFQNL